MELYRIKHSSVTIFILTLLTTILGSVFTLESVLKKDSGILLFLQIALIIFCCFKLARNLSTAEIQITTDSEEIKINWIKQFPFRNKPNISFLWSEILTYKFEPDNNWNKLSIEIKNGNIKILQNSSDQDKDDFLRFLNDFELKINDINSSDTGQQKIKRKPNIYEGKSGLVIAGVAGIAILFIIFFLIFSKREINNPAALVSSGFGALFFIFQVYLHRKKK